MLLFSQIALASAALQLDFVVNNEPTQFDRSALSAFAKRAVEREAMSNDLYLTSSYNFYYTKLLLGTPQQEIEVIIDTGSPVTWVFGPSTTYNNAPQFHPDDSSSFNDVNSSFSASYGTGQYFGSWGTDTAGIPDYEQKKASDFYFGIIDNYAVAAGAPGLLALGPHMESVGPDGYKSLPETLLSQGYVDSAGFSVSLANNTGSILFGGVDTNAYEGDIYSFDFSGTKGNYAGFYTVTLSSLNLGEGDYGVNKASLIDTGSPMSLVPVNFVDKIGEKWNLANQSNYQAYYLDDGRTPEDLEGNITFNLGAFSVDIPISKLFVPGEYLWANDGPQNVQALSLLGSPNVILGDAFIRSVYVTFDPAKQLVYLAKRAENASLPIIVSPDELVTKALQGAVATSTDLSAAFVTSASASGILYGENQYLGNGTGPGSNATGSAVTTGGANSSDEAATSAAASGASGASGAAESTAAASSKASGAAGSGSGSASSSGNNAALIYPPTFLMILASMALL